MAAEARSETVHLYAAGSLRAALSDMAKAFEAESGTAVEAKYGPSGTLKDEIAAGAKADVFAKMDDQGRARSRSTRLLALASALAVFACAGTALADDGCGKFAWPIMQEREAMTAQSQPELASGATFEPGSGPAFRLLLRPSTDAEFVMPPERKSRLENWRGGIVRLPAPPQAGLYQITLSDEAWVDVVQNAGYARSIGSTGRSDCPGLRKSIRFYVASDPIVLQISGASVEVISIAVGSVR
ncbi:MULTISPECIES: substrate-binding domain-containing protein [unclassified Bradyrhizobium]|uniref:substrate-binding domain-containing protein n=1 Tax=unclassified Bradyrhizobium TaxID=2631580 RepID=UPI00211F0778|nr:MULTISPECIES: substrate-binding domain-containing protein [unclassified Bradyrhizobium]